MFNVEDDMMRDPSKSNRIEQRSTSDPSVQLVINYDVRKSNEQNQSSSNRMTTGAEPDQSLQQPTAPRIHYHLVYDCESEAQSFEPKSSAAVIDIEQSYVAAQMEIGDTQEYFLTTVDSVR